MFAGVKLQILIRLIGSTPPISLKFNPIGLRNGNYLHLVIHHKRKLSDSTAILLFENVRAIAAKRYILTFKRETRVQPPPLGIFKPSAGYNLGLCSAVDADRLMMMSVNTFSLTIPKLVDFIHAAGHNIKTINITA